MRPWFIVLLLGAVLGAAKAEESDICLVRGDAPTIYKSKKVYEKLSMSFFRVLSRDQLSKLDSRTTLDGLRDLFKDICPRIQEFTTSITDMHNNITKCNDSDIVTISTVASELMVHLLTSGCENNGGRLALVTRLFYLLVSQRDERLDPLRRCVLQKLEPLSIASGYHNVYHSLLISFNTGINLKKCLVHCDDEQYRSSAQWLLDEMTNTIKCKHVTENRFTLCAETDTTNIPVASMCASAYGPGDVYSNMERHVLTECYAYYMFIHDQYSSFNNTDLSWLQDEYKRLCRREKELPSCLLATSGAGEFCLSQNEDRQFQQELQAIQQFVSRMCVAEGKQLAEVMGIVYGSTPEHRRTVRECLGALTGKASHATGRDLRFYNAVASSKRCLVEKLCVSSPCATSVTVENALDSVLKEMKCVDPVSGDLVFCAAVA